MSAPQDRARFFRQRIDDWATSYLSKGYAVHTGDDVTANWHSTLPFQPDLLAVRPDDRVVVEFKSRYGGTSWPLVREHARLVESLPDWRFELVVVDPDVEPAYPASM